MLLDSSLTPNQIVSMVKALQTDKLADMRRLHEMIEQRRNRYFLKHYDKRAEEGEEQIIFSDEQRLVDTAHDLLLSEAPTIRARPEVEDWQSNIQSDELEAWLHGVLYKQRLRQRVDPLDLFALSMLRDCVGVLQVYWDTALDSRIDPMTGEPVLDEMGGYAGPPLGDLPIVIKFRDPLNVFPQEGAQVGRWDWVITLEEVPIVKVEEEWGAFLPDSTRRKYSGMKYRDKLRQDAKVYDVWSRERDPMTGELVTVNAVVADNDLIKPPTPMPNYRCVPFEIAFCRPTGAKEWDRSGLPITSAIEAIAGERETTWNMIVRGAKLFSQLPLLFEGVGTPPQVASAFGEVAQVKPGEKFSFFPWQGHPPDVYKIAAMFGEEVGAGGLGSPISQAAGKSTSGYALALSGEAGTLRMVAPQNSFSMALTNVLQMVCNLAAAYAPDDTMRVMAEKQGELQPFALKGSDLPGWFIDVKVAGRFPEDKQRDRAMGISLATSPRPILDMRTILQDFMHYENVEQIRQRLLIEQAEQDPNVKALMLALAMDRYGLTEFLQQAQMLIGQQQQAPGQPSPPAPSPTMPVPGIPTQQMPQEELGAMRSQEVGVGPKNTMFPEEQAEEYIVG